MVSCSGSDSEDLIAPGTVRRQQRRQIVLSSDSEDEAPAAAAMQRVLSSRGLAPTAHAQHPQIDALRRSPSVSRQRPLPAQPQGGDQLSAQLAGMQIDCSTAASDGSTSGLTFTRSVRRTAQRQLISDSDADTPVSQHANGSLPL